MRYLHATPTIPAEELKPVYDTVTRLATSPAIIPQVPFEEASDCETIASPSALARPDHIVARESLVRQDGGANPPAPKPPTSDPIAFAASRADPLEDPDLSAHIERLDIALKEHRTAKLQPLADELEKILRQRSRKGALIRRGWLLIARVESWRLLAEKQQGRLADVRRLQALRQEAENVVD